jgi:AcrR family transcriptional regulator
MARKRRAAHQRRRTKAGRSASAAAGTPAQTRRGADGRGEDRIVDAALELAAERGWSGIALADIAAAARLSLAEVYALFPAKGAILDAFVRRIDRATLSGVDVNAAEGSVRDRLFEIVMRRLDALAPHRRAVAAIAGDLPRDPLMALCSGGRLLRSIAWMAGAAGVDTSGLLGPLRVKALAAIYAGVLRVWLGDESADKAKTMAALDRALKQAEMLAQSLSFGGVRTS